ncbi:hypothetical protein [Actinomadura sp. CNU-125]|uniref:hypothetical protein n=1 Tax=Actinomadura sp. CNU-125 TaxID=1904961 RepID=UPI001177D424|nr:hypothetical protein [Actinomadura sp. CNU-125]
MVAGHLMKNAIIIISSTATLSSCHSISIPGTYPAENPRKIGHTVQKLSSEMMDSLPREAEESAGVEFDFCGEEPHKKKEVVPLPDDPWRVDSNLYEFKSHTYFQVNNAQDAPSLYRELMSNLKRVGGWDVSMMHNTANFPSGINGYKQGVSLYASHHPSLNGRTNIKVSLRSHCFKHPNA